MKIAVAGTGYVGLSIALLLSQHNEVHALDIVPKKVELLNNGKSPIVDPVITDFLEKNASGERPLNFHATVNAQEAYADVDFAIIATPTNYDEKKTRLVLKPQLPQYVSIHRTLGSSLNPLFRLAIRNNFAKI